jgi:hypothetical protein
MRRRAVSWWARQQDQHSISRFQPFRRPRGPVTSQMVTPALCFLLVLHAVAHPSARGFECEGANELGAVSEPERLYVGVYRSDVTSIPRGSEGRRCRDSLANTLSSVDTEEDPGTGDPARKFAPAVVTRNQPWEWCPRVSPKTDAVPATPPPFPPGTEGVSKENYSDDFCAKTHIDDVCNRPTC